MLAKNLIFSSIAVLLLIGYASLGVRFDQATEVPDGDDGDATPTPRPTAPVQAPRVPGTMAFSLRQDIFLLREGLYFSTTSESRNSQPELDDAGRTLYFVRAESIEGRRILPDGSVVSATLHYSNVVRKPADGGIEEVVLDGLVRSGDGFHAVSWYLAPALSPDGALLAYIEDDGTGAADLALLDLESGARTILSRGSQLADPAWSPDGGTIAVTTYTQEEPGILLVPIDGTAAARVTGLPEGEPYAPSYSPDGEWLIYTLRTPDGNDVHAYELETGRDVALTDGGRSWKGVFSPDGGWVAFLRERDGAIDVYAMPLEGALTGGEPGEPVRLTHGEGIDGESRPTWGR